VSRAWRPDLAPGVRGGVRRTARLPSTADLAALDPALARIVVLDGPTSRTALFDTLAAALAFPAWFGRNWDALEELLRGPDTDDDRAIVVVWHHPDRLPGPDHDLARAVFSAVATDRREAGRRPLVVLLPAGAEESMEVEEPAMAPPSGNVPESIRSIGRVHHVAVVVRSIEDALPVWRDMLGLRLETVTDVPHDGVRIAFLAVGESRIELVAPTDGTTGVARYLESRGEGFHHVCLEVPNLAEALIRLGMDGLELIDSAPRRGAEAPVAFIHPRSCNGVLVELIEAPGGPAWAQLGFTGD